MNRWGQPILICLLLGAVLNAVETWWQAQPSVFTGAFEAREARRAMQAGAQPFGAVECNNYRDNRQISRYGWPAPSLEGEWPIVVEMPLPKTVEDDSWFGDPWSLRWQAAYLSQHRILWRGVLLSTLAFATIMYVALRTLTWLDQRFARMRKCCPKCNYSLRHIQLNRCPECGHENEPGMLA